MRHIIDAIAAQGRNGDDELLHVSKQELRDLKTIGNAIGIKTTINPKTGIHEAFNWGKMLATGAGGTLGFIASGFNPLGAAAGAAAASGAYTGIEGGSTQDILMNAAISGATAYAGAGIAQGLGEAGQAATQAGGQQLTSGGTEVATQPLVDSGIQGLSMSPELATNTAANTVTNTAVQQAPGSGITGVQLNPELAANAIPTPAPQAMTGADIVKGFQATPAKDLMSQYGSTALKTGVGLGTLGMMPNSDGTSTDTTGFGSGTSYRGETYVTPDGQRRTRAVALAGGGLASMAKGRYLRGPGDGMSDSIPANIDGVQEARLATSEFVVPADVVSHIGNGSSEAGAKELHQMMDRIRQARTGTKKQGKQINPRKYLPA